MTEQHAAELVRRPAAGKSHTGTEPTKLYSAWITEQQVVFSTAAAAPMATRRTSLRATLIAGLGGMLTELTRPRPARPRREATYFQTARMSREMDRL